MKLTLKESMVLAEARDPKLKYSEKQVKGAIDRVTVELEKQKSSAMTKLAQRYFKLDLALKRLSEERDKVNKEMKETVQGLFDATDIVYTRVVETCSFTMTLAKQAQAQEKIDYDFQKVAEELAKLIPDELQAQVDAIMEAHKKVTVTQPRSPAFTVKPKGIKENLTEGVLETLTKLIGSVLKKITNWATGYDKKLAKLKKMAGMPVSNIPPSGGKLEKWEDKGISYDRTSGKWK